MIPKYKAWDIDVKEMYTIPWIFIKLNVDYILVSTCVQMC